MSMIQTRLIPRHEFDRVFGHEKLERFDRLRLLADMCRLNTLNAVKRAGSGHLGTSFSAMDIMGLLYFDRMNVRTVGPSDPNRDVFLSSKGHDVPAQYSILFALGIVSREQLLNLRRLHGLEGHPSVRIRGIEANTGSLGMGISKGRGIAKAKGLTGRGGSVFVMTGDGELQEGQIYESLQTTAHQRIGVTVVVDNNRVQSDKPVAEITDLRDLEAKFRAFGWHVERCDGHDLPTLSRIFDDFSRLGDQPRILIADTVKGRGVSFMEHPRALREGDGIYRWHAGAPDDESFTRANDEITSRLRERFLAAGLGSIAFEEIAPPAKPASSTSTEYVVEAFGQRLLELGGRHPNLVVLDGDLSADCRLRKFEHAYPERFVENGIAEQDMVSMAGGMARHGILPVVNSFGTFLSARANEQIFNNCSEDSRVIYVCHLAGIIPAGPGKSHQSVRDISLFRALPNCVIVEPCCASETDQLLDYCVEGTSESCMMRLVIGPSPRALQLPADYRVHPGRGLTLCEGEDVVVFSSGPVLLHEILSAADALRLAGVGVRVVNMPWLNRVDLDWLDSAVAGTNAMVVIENHSTEGGLGDTLATAMLARLGRPSVPVFKLGLTGYPVCGAPGEVLAHHGLDAASLSRRLASIAEGLGATAVGLDTGSIRSVEADAPIG
jgi:transketolase